MGLRVSLTPSQLYLRRREPVFTELEAGWATELEHYGEQINLLPLPVFKPWIIEPIP
jgi:hypothetical protein